MRISFNKVLNHQMNIKDWAQLESAYLGHNRKQFIQSIIEAQEMCDDNYDYHCKLNNLKNFLTTGVNTTKTLPLHVVENMGKYLKDRSELYDEFNDNEDFNDDKNFNNDKNIDIDLFSDDNENDYDYDEENTIKKIKNKMNDSFQTPIEKYVEIYEEMMQNQQNLQMKNQQRIKNNYGMKNKQDIQKKHKDNVNFLNKLGIKTNPNMQPEEVQQLIDNITNEGSL